MDRNDFDNENTLEIPGIVDSTVQNDSGNNINNSSKKRTPFPDFPDENKTKPLGYKPMPTNRRQSTPNETLDVPVFPEAPKAQTQRPTVSASNVTTKAQPQQSTVASSYSANIAQPQQTTTVEIPNVSSKVEPQQRTTDISNNETQVLNFPEYPQEVKQPQQPTYQPSYIDDDFYGSDDDDEDDDVPSRKKKPKKKKRYIKTTLLWGYFLIASIVFSVIFFLAPMIPFMWKIIEIAILGLIVAIFGILSIKPSTKKNPFVRAVNVILAVLLTIMSVLLPYYESRITNLIDNNTGVVDDRVKMNLYAVTDAYRQEHSDVFTDSAPISVSNDQELSDDKFKSAYSDSTIISMINTDNSYQIQAISKLDEVFGKSSTLVDKESVTEGVEALYNNEGSLLLMNETQIEILNGLEEYEDFTNNAKVVYTIYLDKESEEVMTGTSDLTTQPFSVFFGGNDEEGELKLTGRTDVDMVVTVNPITHQIIISSFPRDSYVPNPALYDRGDKLTHLGVSGLSNTLEGLSNVLETEIENYIVINFSTYRMIIDALGGVDIDNPYGFEADDGEYFEEGMIHISGDSALMYVRERHHLPDGDFGRNMHQQLVMKAIIEKLSSPEVIVRFDALLKALDGTFLTNLSSDAIYGFCQMQLTQGIEWNVMTYRAEGSVGEAVTASMPSQNLSVVFPYANQVAFMVEQINKLEDGEILEQQEMPTGSGVYLEPWTTLVEETSTPEETEDTTSTPAPTTTTHVHDSNGQVETIPATCETDGEVRYYCSAGDGYYVVETIPATGHSWGDWVNNGDGTLTRTCTKCGAVDSGTAG